MNSKQRYLATLNGEPTDLIPRLPILMQFAAKYIGHHSSDCAQKNDYCGRLRNRSESVLITGDTCTKLMTTRSRSENIAIREIIEQIGRNSIGSMRQIKQIWAEELAALL